MIGFIGGYGLHKLLKNEREFKFRAVFDDELIAGSLPDFAVFEGKIGGKDVVVIPRHGKKHELPPHNIPFKSMIKKFKELGVGKIISVNSVGILNIKIPKKSFILLDDFVNEGKEVSYFNKFPGRPVHINMGRPYDKEMNAVIKDAAEEMGIELFADAVYVNSTGPRLETRAEIERKYKKLGDVIGMTNAYEVILANEAGISISSICLAANYAEGLGESVDFNKVVEEIESMKPQLFKLLRGVVGRL
jgi:5'-methylthioadenosine phosphorylase